MVDKEDLKEEYDITPEQNLFFQTTNYIYHNVLFPNMLVFIVLKLTEFP